VEELRDFYPTSVEMEEIIFKQWCLDDLDRNIRKGISNWTKSKSEEAGPSSNMGPPSRPVNPYQMSFSEQARRGAL